MIALVDCNNFYASCEKVFDPSIGDKPLVVLSNNDGCVIARSAEAKAMGIPMAEPYYKIKPLVKEKGVVVKSSNFRLYGDLSRRVTNILRAYAPQIEVYSIDESFLDFTGIENIEEISWNIRNQVQKWVGITVCVGVGPSKTIAKTANHYAKKSQRGVTIISSPYQIKRLREITPIDEIWGIGRKLHKRLRSYNIKTADDFVQKLDHAWIQRNMSITGVRTWEELQGKSVIPLEPSSPPKQSITTSRSFGVMISDYALLKEAVMGFTDSCAQKLRRDKLVAREITLFITSNRFRDDEEQYRNGERMTLEVPTADSQELIRCATILLNAIFRDAISYKKAGVIVSKLVPENEVQCSLFDSVNRTKSDALMKSMDNLTEKYGFGAVRLGAVGVQKKDWVMKQEQRSPQYTTSWSEIIEIDVSK